MSHLGRPREKLPHSLEDGVRRGLGRKGDDLEGLGFRVQSSGFRVQGLGIRV